MVVVYIKTLNIRNKASKKKNNPLTLNIMSWAFKLSSVAALGTGH